MQDLPLWHNESLRLQQRQDAKAHRRKAILTQRLADRRIELLALGSPGRLWIADQIADVLPLDDAAGDAVHSLTPDGGIPLEPVQAKAALKHGSFALLVLDGGQALTQSIRRMCPRACEYLRVTTAHYQELARQD
jgi:hypothetical protein